MQTRPARRQARRPDADGRRGLPNGRTGGSAGRASVAFPLFLFTAFLALAAVGFVGAVGAYAALSRGLDDPRGLEELQFNSQSVIYDRTGEVELARFGSETREEVAFEEIPAILLDATTAVEDKTFWTNTGFDPLGIAAALRDSLRGDARGASTITQQLVRQRLLDPDLVRDSDRTPERKLKEIIQSIRITQAYPAVEGKQRIITAYLNQNYYGNNSYGVKAAARGYFGLDDLSQLTLA
ncbi:MAG: transglycosylase domain-containing protein, partial [Chloroflexi bacterium]|nr:transglycosylase domain-containing protein [Chloroflexota bacterium]